MTAHEGHSRIRLLAFYLTQFHPTPENDHWWGKGFTEWTNVTKAKELFDGHYQPHLPTDLGFYDLRLEETRRDQIALAKEYGIDGFCYHYYWFSGTRILNRPLDAMLADTGHDMPFCLCWANESWSRRWDGADHELLISQQYLPGEELDFIKGLIPFFKDSRYIRLNGAPVLVVYRPQHLPDARKAVQIWRDYCESEGLGRIHLVACLTHGNDDYVKYGFDSGVEFPPHNTHHIKGGGVNHQLFFHAPFYGRALQYHEVARFFLDRTYRERNVFRTVSPSWDNTARVGARALVILNGTPENYEYWLAESIRRTEADFPGEERFVFINAWNEWAEGCHLEPDRKFGRGFLEATLRAKFGHSRLRQFTDTSVPHVSFGRDLAGVMKKHFARLVAGLKFHVNRFPWLRRLALICLSVVYRLLRRHRNTV
ncbi:MAG: glycoside hydrolase family 99-like domain-containing protein [Zoogloeaceae bacterium]|nr:glycoside hydrolase family 99-like domain-containing protein [Zoogloeaceae bacterium]